MPVTKGMAAKPFKKILASLLVATYSTCFLLQVRDQVGKYLAEETTTATQMVAVRTLWFPTVTVCPCRGYRSGTNAEKESFPYSFGENLTRKEAELIWRNATIPVGEFLMSVVVVAGDQRQEVTGGKNSSWI